MVGKREKERGQKGALFCLALIITKSYILYVRLCYWTVLPRCMDADAVYSDENSVCASVKRVHCDKTEEKSVQIFIPYERSFSLVFWEEEWLMGRPLLFEILGQPAPVEAKSPILNFARSASVVTPSEKSSINTNGSLLRAFQWA